MGSWSSINVWELGKRPPKHMRLFANERDMLIWAHPQVGFKRTRLAVRIWSLRYAARCRGGR